MNIFLIVFLQVVTVIREILGYVNVTMICIKQNICVFFGGNVWQYLTFSIKLIFTYCTFLVGFKYTG